MTIGGAIGEVKEVDLDAGMVRVVVNGFNPLCFETSVEFHSGEEIPITIRYERLFGFCRKCFSLCHDEKECGQLVDGVNGNDGPPTDNDMGSRFLSYKGVVNSKGTKLGDGGNAGQQGKKQGKRPVYDGIEETDTRRAHRDSRQYRSRDGGRYGGDGSRGNRNRDAYPRQERRYGNAGSDEALGLQEATTCTVLVEESNQLEENVVIMEKQKTDNGLKPVEGKIVRKELFPTDSIAQMVMERSGDEIRGERNATVGQETRGDMVMEDQTIGLENHIHGNGSLLDVAVSGITSIEHEFELGEVTVDDMFEVLNSTELTVGEQLGQNGDPLGLMTNGPMGQIGTQWEEEDTEALVNKEVNLHEEAEALQNANPKPEQKKLVKGNTMLKGVSSKKRMVQSLVSPRRKNGTKKEVQYGDERYPGKSGKAMGTLGGLQPPKPDSN